MDNKLEQNNQNSVGSKKTSSNIFNIILSIIILIMFFVAFKYGNFGSISKKELEANYIKKTELSFNNLSSFEKNNYISMDKYLFEVDKLKNQEEKIVYKEKIIKPKEKVIYKEKIVKAEPKIIYKDKIIESEPQIIEKTIYKDKIIESEPQIIEKIIYKDKIIDKSKFNVFRCYGMSPSGYRMSAKCETNLKKFLQENKSAKFFEVIAVMNPKDFRTIMILEQKTDLLKELDLNKKQVETLKNLSTVGLDKLRVVETIWGVKKALGKKTIVVPVPYNVYSKKYRGTVLRAYK